MLTTPRVLLTAVLVGTALSLTAIDKYDEGTCRSGRAAVDAAEAAVFQSRYQGYSTPRSFNFAGPRGRDTTTTVRCDGFLPW